MYFKNKYLKGYSLFKLAKGLNSFYQSLCVLACIIFYSFTSSSAYAETTITNTATASYSINGSAQTQSSSVNLIKDTVVLPADQLKLKKQADKNTAKVGDLITYTLTLTNPNTTNLKNVSLQDTLPTGLIYQVNTATLIKSAAATPISANNISVIGNDLKITIGEVAANSTWQVKYQIKVMAQTLTGAAINKAIALSDTATSTTVQAVVTIINKRTPSTITFFRIDDSGTPAVIPPTSYNDSKTGGKHWQEVSTIKLADGSIIDLPTPQPLVEANQYEISEPIIIQVKDLDQNTDSSKIDTIFVTIEVAGTNDKEILLLRETSPNSGIFRGIIVTTSDTSERQNGQLSLKAGQKITVKYRDENDSTDTTTTAAFVTAKLTGSKLALLKTVNKTTATMGEKLHFTLNFINSRDTDLLVVNIQDTLPLGVHYIAGSATLNGTTLTDNQVLSKGRSLQFKLATMPKGDSWSVEYVTKITASARVGKITNTARVRSVNFRSNLAHASVVIKDDLMRTKNILTGRVYIGCKTRAKSKVLKNARIYLETGRSILSDKNGFWHMEGVEAGTHVLQLDKNSLPKGYQAMSCKENTRHAGKADSQFVNLQAGTLWQVNFHVKADPEVATENTASTGDTDNLVKKAKIKPFDLFGKAYLETANSDFEILWPKNNYVPEISSTKIVIKSSPQQRVEVYLNGKKVNPLNYDGGHTNSARTASIKRWAGVDISITKRDNTLLAILKDKSGKELARKTHNIHFSGEIASAEYLADKSVLIADGKTVPMIALLIKDEDGFPMRANTHGYFILKNGRYQVQTLEETVDELNINNDSGNGSFKYHIEADGIAYIKLNPTSQAGELKLDIKLQNDSHKEVSAWLKPALRDWILVGLAEGTLAHKTLSGNMQTLDGLGKDEKITKDGRIAFFAKGRIKGKYLLTIAYDTHKKSGARVDETNNNIDPDAWYNIYADNSHSQFDAASSKKLYVKIERNNFYTLFGDFKTNLNVTELAKYERSLTGVKSERNGKRLSYSAFASETSDKHHHQEIQGDGTSGLYHLSHDIVVNSETIKIETRDRFHSEQIIESKTLTRYQDYEIDYDAGTLFFKFPVAGRRDGFNPQFIVIDYDSESDNNKLLVAGGRIATKTKNQKLEVGASIIHISGDKSKNNSIIALDSTYQLTPDTKIHAEIAQSKSALNDHKTTTAQILELEKEIADMEAKIFYRKQNKGFGLGSEGSSSASQEGTKKFGAEIKYKLNNKTTLKGEISQQENLETNNKRQLAEVSVEHEYDQLAVKGGLRHSKEKLSNQSVSNDTAIAGVSYTTKGNKVTYRAEVEENFNSSSIEERSPDRKVFGVDIKINNGMTLFAEHELTNNHSTKTQNSRVGVSKSLWQGAKAKTSYTKERTSAGQRDYATLGLNQRIQVTKKLSADISIDHAKTLGSKQERFNDDEATPQGSNILRDDYTAFSVGMGSHIKDWSWTGRLEMREGDFTDKQNLRLGFLHRLKNGKQVSAKIDYVQSDNKAGGYDKTSTISVGTAWHPKHKDFVVFNRLDLVNNESNLVDVTSKHTQKIIHNMHYNRRLSNRTQFGLHHGLKHIIDKDKQSKHKVTIDTGSIELRRDLREKGDIGVRAGYLYDWDEKTSEIVAGISLGVTPIQNAWLELGYNFNGFNDDDFDDNNFKRKGPYISFRYKFDQNSFTNNLPVRHKLKK